MKYYPPINERLTNELLDIVSDDNVWVSEIQALAEEELYQRNFTKQAVTEEKRKKVKIATQLKERRLIQFEKNRTESYTIAQMISIVVGFPFLLFLELNPLAEFWRLDAENYRRKIWQRIVLIMISLLLWLLIIMLIV